MRTMYIILATLVVLGLSFGTGILTISAEASTGPWVGKIYIFSDGSVHPSDAPMKVSKDNYKLTSDIDGTITVVRSGVVLNGDGHLLYGDRKGNGIYLDGQNGTLTDITVKNFDIDHHTNGILCLYVEDCKFMNNEISDVRGGLMLFYCDDNTIADNSIVDIRFGVYLFESCDNQIRSNLIHGTNYDWTSMVVMGVGLRMGSCYNTVKDNTIYDMDNDGVYVDYDSNYNVIKNNDISYCWDGGINMFFTSYNEILDNTIDTCYFGIGLYYDNSYHSIRDNHISNGIGGIGLFLCQENFIKGNYFCGNYDCINLAYSEMNIFRENVIESGTHAFWLEESYDNVIYHNDIIDYEYAFDTTSYYGNPGTSESENIWDNGKGEGNYWSDYEGSDTDGDGIGDTDLPHAGVDDYPLMEPYN